jgi:oligoendopeptidase F
MLSSVERRYDIAQRFYNLKARLLGIDRLAYHERNVPVGTLEQQYTFDESMEIVRAVFNGLDPDFSEILETMRQAGQFDVYPRPGKVGGAFCAHALITQPTYVLLNHTGRLNDVLTLAHEMGHAINNELTRKFQNSLNFDTSLATAEVASTFMEDFVIEHIEKQTSSSDRLSILMMKLNDDVSSIFRQVSAYRFEQALHGEYAARHYVEQKEIGRLFQAHMGAYMGPSVEQSPGSENWWVYWSHFRNHFYVYSYASGLLISKSLQQMVRDEPESIMAVKRFLAAGTSAAPSTIFADIGIDIADASFWERGISAVEQNLEEAEQLALNI